MPCQSPYPLVKGSAQGRRRVSLDRISFLQATVFFVLSFRNFNQAPTVAAFTSQPVLQHGTRWCHLKPIIPSKPNHGTSSNHGESKRSIVLSNSLVDEALSTIGELNKQREKKLHEETVPSTMPDAIRRFYFGGEYGPLLVVAAITLLVLSRIHMHMTTTPVTLIDITACMGAVVFWWFQENIMHDKLLHSNFDWEGKRIHIGHHNRPYFHVSIDPPELLLGWLFAVFCLLKCFFSLPLATSITIGYASAGLFYEWMHYLVHTRVRPRWKIVQRMRDNHMRHHLIDDGFWFGFSVPAIDDIFGTNPSVKEVRQKKYRDRESK